ncbi:cell morphogenesis N-terminal-domain-containing protein [Suillus clintonianus]|uniref:cell morphogenesis N-terminal-domain-containing protein n=1 Tax=Suillus clintonianus TaxID=1904413 RepID=UPI001B87B14B|nr:cell morphogenesis N-terminal-domain-containing protein [Suillus clintonianus]KAG2124183.1 cell morphogenesis N-terminal-domain-containing protein [Suillus clintonianus]
MSSEGVLQITIPDFDDGDFQSTPIPFGRSGGHGFGAFGNAGSGPDSPTIMTPIALPERSDRSYFHSRGDSAASEDSFISQPVRQTGKSSHTTQPSITASSPFSKKPSFASIRNAFKKNTDVPPLPPLDHQAYPILKNPFKPLDFTFNATSPPHPRPPTPGSSEPRPRAPSRARGHSTARSHHSQSGSIFHNSDTGSDHGHGFPYSSSPPPVPRVPDAFGAQVFSSDGPSIMEEDDQVPSGLKMPSDYALHAVFIRFATLAEAKMDVFLRETLDHEPLLSDFMGPSLDPKFDDLMGSLGKIAQKHPKPVIDSIRRWRRSHNENVSADILKYHASQSPLWTRGARVQEPSTSLNERNSLALIYIMCRALIAVLSVLSKDALGDALGFTLEETTFEQFKRPDLKLLAQSANHRLNAELYATLLGHLANVRFVSVTDRFLGELEPVANGQVAKDLDTKYEHLVKGLRHVQLRVWPPEAFEEGAEFLELIAKSFANAHGLRFKIAFADTLTRLLHPIGKTAQAEVNHPQWEKAIERIYPRAKEMMSKPRYWHIAYPLAVTSLCVAPHQYFLRNWTSCFEYGLSKMKEKPHRIPVLNGIVRLIWTYLYRCQEPLATSTAKLDSLLKHIFPAGRSSIFHHEEHLEPFICIVHFILSRYFDYGLGLCMDLLQEAVVNSASTSNLMGILAPERVAVSSQAILLTLNAFEREEPAPTWPSSVDFTAVPSWDDYPSSSDALPAVVVSRHGVQELLDRYGAVITAIARSASQSVGQMSIFDEQWSLSRFNSVHEESHNIVICRRPEGSFAYPNHLVSQISMLQTCLQSWPRCLHASLPLTEAINMLIRGLIHVEPRIGEAAAAALRRFMADGRYAPAVLCHFTTFLFDPAYVGREGTGARLVLESSRLLNFWISLVEGWVKSILQKPKADITAGEKEAIALQGDGITAGALFLLSHEASTVRCAGVKLIRILAPFVAHVDADEGAHAGSSMLLNELLDCDARENPHFQGFDELLDSSELDRLQQWRRAGRKDVLLRIADSNYDKDKKIWRCVFPNFMQASFQQLLKVAADCRAMIEAAASRYHPSMLHLAGLSTLSGRLPAGSSRAPGSVDKDGYKQVKDNMNLIDQWYLWIKILCATATVSDSRGGAPVQASREHSRAPSDERDRMTTTRSLFRYLTPFLDVEYAPFRDAAVLSISSFPSSGFSSLLEDLNHFAFRQFYDDARSKSGSSGSIGRSRRQARLHSAVARIYFLTAPQLQHQRSSAKQDAISCALKFIRNMQTFLVTAENRDNYALQRLRRYFCGLVERFFDSLANLADSERFVSPYTYTTLYRLCEEWCQYGVQSESAKQRHILMQRAAAAAVNDPQAESDSAERFQHETKLLSNAALGALAALCQRAYYPSEIKGSSSPTDRPQDPPKPLEAVQILDRLHHVFQSSYPQVVACGRKALRSLISSGKVDKTLLGEVLRRSFIDSNDSSSSSSTFFEVLSEVACDVDVGSYTFAQIICLGLTNLCHANSGIRRKSLMLLEAMHEHSSGVLSFGEFEAMIANPSSSVYLHAHRLVTERLSGEHPNHANDVITEMTTLLMRMPRGGNERVALLLLQSLESWVPNIQLTLDPDNEARLHPSPASSRILYHLLTLTKRYNESHFEQVAAIWTRFADYPNETYGAATVTFLINQALKVATSAFVDCASTVVACLSRSAAALQVYELLCYYCEPERMVPSLDHQLKEPPGAEDFELWSDLNAQFAEEQPKILLGPAQYALILLGSAAMEGQWTHVTSIPVILQAIFPNLDHRVPLMRIRARGMLFQLLRVCVPGLVQSNCSALVAQISALEDQGDSIFWKDDDASDIVETRMSALFSQVFPMLQPLVPALEQTVGSLALAYVELCNMRSLALRSLQVLRVLKLPLSHAALDQLLSRLSVSIADVDPERQAFSAEVIRTITYMVTLDELDGTLLPRLFWTTYAVLTTSAETEYTQAIKLLAAFLDRIDLDVPHIADLILAQRPRDWNGSIGLQQALLSGLRSATTLDDTFMVLRRLAKLKCAKLFDSPQNWLRDLFTLSLPWCMNAMCNDQHDEALNDFCSSIADLADEDGLESINRIMVSFVKRRFRTKDDFLRQSIGSLRDHYPPDDWSDIATLLLSLVLNKERWLQIYSMHVLKVLFQQRALQSLGTEHLMPLLRLVEGDLATQALDVLEEPTKITGGLTAKQVLRMSMHVSALAGADETDIFGVPEDSGWCIARVQHRQAQCRANVLAVALMFTTSSRISTVHFQPEVQEPLFEDELDEDLGVLVQDLHELSEFFQKTKPQTRLLPSQQLEDRVASILARSTDDSDDLPQTPFGDVFQIGGSRDLSDDSSDESDTESEVDAFKYDSPSFYRTAPNGKGLY